MKSKTLKILTVMLVTIMFFTVIPVNMITVKAASYTSDWQQWSQGASDYSGIRDYGCWVVAQAKLIRMLGIDDSPTFNPDIYLAWEQSSGHINSGYYQVNGDMAPIDYAAYKGKTLWYCGIYYTTTDVWNCINNGDYGIICVSTSSSPTGSHWILLDNERSKSTSEICCYDSFSNSTISYSVTLREMSYNFVSIYTYRYDIHTHSYGAWQTVKAATCTTDGSRKRVCSCGDTQTETIPATGHKIVNDAAISATCMNNGLTAGSHCSVCNAVINAQKVIKALGHNYQTASIYHACDHVSVIFDCTRCGAEKVETSDSYIMSEWLGYYPSEVDKNLIEMKTQYSYRVKSIKESDKTSLSGWTRDDSKTKWSEYGEWSEWQNTAVSKNEYREVISENVPAVTHTEYNYSRYINVSAGIVGPWAGTWSGVYCGQYQERGWGVKLENPDTSQGFEIYQDSRGGWFNETSRTVTDSQAYTRYKYRERHKIYTYYKWSGYSDWSDEVYEPSETREVETRTVYRYKILNTGHAWQTTWDYDNDKHWHECSGCEAAIDIEEHVYENENDTICSVCGFVRTNEINDINENTDINENIDVLKGDCNGDGEINNKDVVTLFRFVSNVNDEYKSLFDFNEDGNVDNKDVVALFRHVSGIVPKTVPDQRFKDITGDDECYIDVLLNYGSNWDERLINWGRDPENLIGAYYCIKDINNDGVNEVVISKNGEYISAIYTRKDKRAVCLYFQENKGSAGITSDGFVYKSYKDVAMYKLEDAELISLYYITYNYDYDGDYFEDLMNRDEEERDKRGISKTDMVFEYKYYEFDA